jgi:probable HAF family extracellular repeat protein
LLTTLASAQTFTTIDFPGGFGTQPTAVNASGIIVGRYSDATNHSHGFVLAAGKYVAVDVPNATDTELNWINPSGQIVGDYTTADGKTHAFVLDAGKFTFFDYPGAFDTRAWGISPSGNIVGTHSEAPGTTHGYLRTKQGALTAIDFPGMSVTFASMLNEKSVVGFYVDSTPSAHAYLFSDGNYQPVSCPGWDGLVLTSLNPQGDMTGGGFRLADGRPHGVVVSNGKCTAVDYPGSVGADYVNSMNPRGDLVGTYATPDFQGHGYLRTKR